MEHREAFYECVFSLQGEECRLVVHAWDAEGAATHVVRELESAGLPSPFSVSVRPLAPGQAGENHDVCTP